MTSFGKDGGFIGPISIVPSLGGGPPSFGFGGPEEENGLFEFALFILFFVDKKRMPFFFTSTIIYIIGTKIVTANIIVILIKYINLLLEKSLYISPYFFFLSKISKAFDI